MLHTHIYACIQTWNLLGPLDLVLHTHTSALLPLPSHNQTDSLLPSSGNRQNYNLQACWKKKAKKYTFRKEMSGSFLKNATPQGEGSLVVYDIAFFDKTKNNILPQETL